MLYDCTMLELNSGNVDYIIMTTGSKASRQKKIFVKIECQVIADTFSSTLCEAERWLIVANRPGMAGTVPEI